MRADGMRTAHCILQPGSERKEGIWSVKRRSSVLERTPPCAAVKQSSPSASAAAWLFFSTLLFGSQCFPAQRVASCARCRANAMQHVQTGVHPRI